MKIVALTATGVKRLTAVHIEPDGNLVPINGRNGQGKTSVLDSIFLALAGGDAAKAIPKPVNDTAGTAEVVLDLGDIIVTRRWTAKGTTTLKVTSADGATYSAGQTLLNDMLGDFTFDPLAFTRMSDRDQRATLLELVDLPFDPEQLDTEAKRIFDTRTEVNRDVKAARARLDAMTPPADDAPMVEVSAAEVMGEFTAAQQQQAANDQARAELRAVTDQAHAQQQRVDDLRRQLADAEDLLTQVDAERNQLVAEVADLVDPDTDAIAARLDALEATNATIRANQLFHATAADLAAVTARSAELTAQLDAIDTRRREAISAAAMPIEGLGFDEQGVTYMGQPLKQASGAEQLRVSTAIGMAANPKIRVLRITDGSLLDADNLALLGAMADANDFQVWIERVGTDGDGWLIEDGHVIAEPGGTTTTGPSLFEDA